MRGALLAWCLVFSAASVFCSGFRSEDFEEFHKSFSKKDILDKNYFSGSFHGGALYKNKYYFGTISLKALYSVNLDTLEVYEEEPFPWGEADDVAVRKSDGLIAWSSILRGEVHLRFPNGTRHTVALKSANPIKFNEEGRLFVAPCFGGTGVYEVILNHKPYLRKLSNSDGLMINSFEFSKKSNEQHIIYAPNIPDATIIRYNIESGEREVLLGNLHNNFGVALNSDNELLYVLQGHGIIQSFKHGIAAPVFKSNEMFLDNFEISEDHTFLVVTGIYPQTVFKLDLETLKQTYFVGPSYYPAMLNFAIDREGTMFITAVCGLFKSKAGSNQYTIIHKGFSKEYGIFGGPIAVGDHYFAAACIFSSAVIVYNKESGTIAAAFDKNEFVEVRGLSFDNNGHLYLAEKDKISRIAVSAEFKENEKEVLLDNLQDPVGIEYWNGFLYVAERKTGKIIQYDISNKISTVIITDLVQPSSVKVIPVKNSQTYFLAVTESGRSRVILINLAGNARVLGQVNVQVDSLVGALDPFFSRDLSNSIGYKPDTGDILVHQNLDNSIAVFRFANLENQRNYLQQGDIF